EVAYQADARPEDVIHFVTDMGWIMGPWEVVGGMALGCTVVFAEGAPDWPAADRLWGLVESEGVSILGLSPTLVRALIPHGAEVGELVCRKPFPGMTRGFWGDPERYLDTYWRRLPGIWVHGDWALVDEDGFWFLYGRSDDTLNIAGKRLGPSELESAMVAHPA